MYKFYKNLVHPEENILAVSLSLVDAFKVPITQTTLKKALEEHPDYPSMLSMSDVLNHFNISNIAAKIKIEQLKDFDVPFVVLIKPKGSNSTFYSLVIKVNEESITFSSPKKQTEQTLNWKNFEEIYQGVTFLAEPEEDAGENNYKQQLKKEKTKKFSLNATLLLIPILTIVYGLYEIIFKGFQPASISVAFTWFSLVGWIISSLLLWYEIDGSNTALQEVCGGKNNQRTDCGSVLQSKAASIFGFSWSMIGFSYFSALLFSQLIAGLTNPSIAVILAVLTVLASLYIPFSIFIQWKVIKKWCKLCVMIQTILLAQLILILAAGWLNRIPLINEFPMWEFALTFFTALISLILLNQLLPVFKQSKLSKSYKDELLKLKYNKDIFNSVLEKQKHLTLATKGLGIILGNLNAKHRIIKVCNPYCGPCAKAHQIIDDLLKIHNDLSVQIIFTASNEKNDIRSLPSKHLLAIAEKGDEERTKRALDDWYNASTKSYEDFAQKYIMNDEVKMQSSKVENMKKWCQEVEIAFTPTFFINGYQMPENYTIKDMTHLLEQ